MVDMSKGQARYAETCMQKGIVLGERNLNKLDVWVCLGKLAVVYLDRLARTAPRSKETDCKSKE